MKHIVVFASGSGTNFQALIDAAASGRIPAKIKGLISNKSGITAITRAKKNGIEYTVLEPLDFESRQSYEEALLKQLESWETDLIVLAGYMIKIPSSVINTYRGRIINIHPSLLPKYGGKGYYGLNVHRAVIENEEPVSGCTVHLVNEEYDKGPILAQEEVAVYESDDAESLSKRVLEKEHELLPRVVSELINELNVNS